MIVALAFLLQVAAPDSLPAITLDDALKRAAKLDPEYVTAQDTIDVAAWEHRSAWLAMFVPSVTATTNATRYSSPSFNFGTNALSSTSVNAELDAHFTIFGGGAKLAQLSRTRANLESAQAAELKARYDLAYRTESDFFGVLADQELARVARDRVSRAVAQLDVARARVTSGAAVATDSLQLVLELDRARVSQLQSEAALRVSRLQLGRRVGIDGRVQAMPTDTGTPPDLPFTLAAAVAEARQRGPEYLAARAQEKAGEALVKQARGSFLPQIDVGASTAAWDNTFFPSATTRSWFFVQASLPLWNNGTRETNLALARAARDIATATRRDKDRAVERDVTEAYEGFGTARASSMIAAEAVLVARENYRVQETRYRAGATTILDLLGAQVSITEAESDLVQARYAARLALARLESILGRRIFDQGTSQ